MALTACPRHPRQGSVFILCRGVPNGVRRSAAPTIQRPAQGAGCPSRAMMAALQKGEGPKSAVRLDLLETYLHTNVLGFPETRLLALLYCLMLTLIRLMFPLIPPLNLSIGWKKIKPPEAENQARQAPSGDLSCSKAHLSL